MKVRDRIKFGIKSLLCHALYYSGVLRVWQRVALRGKTVVLMYHRVLTPEERQRSGSHPGIVVDRATFARQMAVLKRHFVVLTIDEFARHLEQRIPFPDSSCLITFDDGWLDNYTNALPVLAEHRLPAVIFLPVNYIGARRLFSREALTQLLVVAVERARTEPATAAALRRLLAAAGLERVLDTADEDVRAAVVAALAANARLSGPAVDALVGSLATALGVRIEELAEGDRFIDWAQVEVMARSGIAFGGHGADHHVLSHVPSQVATEEIVTSKRVVDGKPGAAPAFAYPGGGWSPAVAQTVRDTGYRLAFTTDAGHVRCDDDPFTLRRVNIHEDVTASTSMFMARVVGLC